MFFGGKASSKTGKIWSSGSYYKGSIIDVKKWDGVEEYDPWECLKVKTSYVNSVTYVVGIN